MRQLIDVLSGPFSMLARFPFIFDARKPQSEAA
jgi:hypothetical protein